MYIHMGLKKKNYYIKKERVTLPKWKVVSGTTCDDTILSDGEKQLTWDEWFQDYYN